MIQIANAPCSWGVIENLVGDRFGYKNVLTEMQEAGYAGTELGDWGFMPTDPAKLATELKHHALQLLGSWVSVRLYDASYHDAGIAQAVKTARLMAEVGGPDCFVIIGDDHSTIPDRSNFSGRITQAHWLNEAGWEVYTTGAMRVAEAVKKETGLRSIIHHHGATYVETPEEIDEFMARTDPDLVGLCFDTGHCALGGGDPVAVLKKHHDRIWHVHFKDFDPEIVEEAKVAGWDYQGMIGRGLFPELGQGNVDFASVLETLQDLNYKDWIVVEQDVLPGMGTPRDSAIRNRAFLKALKV
ncbi:MAG: TIM barrel protein [Bacteroidota bacterium]